MDGIIYCDAQGKPTDAWREWRKLDAASAAYKEYRRRLLVEGATASELARFMQLHRRIKWRFLITWLPAAILVKVPTDESGGG